MFQRFILLSTLFFLAGMQAAFAWPPTYGSEHTFGSKKITEAFNARAANKGKNPNWQEPGPVEQAGADDFAAEVKKRCGEECTVTPHKVGKWANGTEYKVVFKNGYSFNISMDPKCVEIQTAPETLEQIQKYEGMANEYIFGTAKAIGMAGTGLESHFNIGIISAFDDDAKSFMRFFTNYHNNQELASGALGLDFENAPPLSHLKPEQREAFNKLLQEVNMGKITSAKILIARIQKEVYTSTPHFASTVSGSAHYQGIGLKQINRAGPFDSDRPFELRAMRQPENAEQRTLMAQLFEKRIAYEKRTEGPIRFLDLAKPDEFKSPNLANRFRMYVLEMGEDWQKFNGLLSPELRNLSPDVFITGKINWRKGRDIKTLKEYAPYMDSSPWVNQKMEAFLASPEAIESGNVPAIRQAIEEYRAAFAKANPDWHLIAAASAEQDQIRAILLEKSEPPKYLKNCMGFFGNLMKKLRR